jgi:dihydrofolate reductase
MRNIILGLGISLDGYIARRNGAVDFLFMPKDYSMAPFFATIDTTIMGRKTLDAAGGSYPESSLAGVCLFALEAARRTERRQVRRPIASHLCTGTA